MTPPAVVFPADWATLSVVLAHDWLTGMRGGERVLELLCEGFPRAPILTLIHRPAAMAAAINRHPIHTSVLQRVPGMAKGYRYALPLFPWIAASFRAPPAGLLISTSHCYAKGVRPPPGARHLCYCFTPMRYAWTFYEEYFGGGAWKRLATRPLLAGLRRWDRRTAAGVDRFVAISRHVQRRIRDFYGRDADVVYPPVATGYFTPGPAGHDGFDLVVSALVPYKRVDLAVRAYTRLGYPLKVVGAGTEFAALRRRAGPRVEFTGWLPDEAVRELYRRCRCLVFPGEEDFGLVPLEAQACGKPVIALARGGALETVAAGVTGMFFNEPTEDALLAAVEEGAARVWDAAAIRRHAAQFGPQPFIDGLARSIRRCLGADPGGA